MYIQWLEESLVLARTQQILAFLQGVKGIVGSHGGGGLGLGRSGSQEKLSQ